MLTAQPPVLYSPDRHLAVQVDTAKLAYQVSLDGAEVLAASRLGLVFNDGCRLGEKPTLLSAKTSSKNEVWTDAFGPNRRVVDRWNQVQLEFTEQSRKYGVQIRAYNDGIAIRYELPVGGYTAREDLTEFAYPTDSVAWGGQMHSSTEVNYPETRLNQLPQGNMCLPVAVQSGKVYTVVAESNLLDWPGMFVRRSGQNKLQASLASTAVGSGPRYSPWRVVMISNTAKGLVESNLIKNLAEPCRIADTSWIKPGISAWDPWWTGRNPNFPQFRGLDSRGDTKSHKQYIDLAAEMGWSYQLVDWNWYDMGSPDPETAIKPLPLVNIPELLQYAKSKDVRLILWVHSKDVNRIGAEKLFSTYESWGVAGVKIDFMDNDGQEMVRWYEETLACAARHHLLVNFHGAYKPTGLARTYPNYITQEGVLGNEYNKLPGRLFTPEHMVTLPFTRGLLGPADVTPGAFLNKSVKDFHTMAIPAEAMGSCCRQLALTVTMFSPLLCMCDAPENYRGQPGIEFMRGLPTVWDETVVLQAEFGKSLVLARRKGQDWWIAAMNSTTARNYEIDLSSIAKGSYQLETFSDGEHPQDVRIETKVVDAKTPLNVHLMEAGGFVARLRKIKS